MVDIINEIEKSAQSNGLITFYDARKWIEYLTAAVEKDPSQAPRFLNVLQNLFPRMGLSDLKPSIETALIAFCPHLSDEALLAAIDDWSIKGEAAFVCSFFHKIIPVKPQLTQALYQRLMSQLDSPLNRGIHFEFYKIALTDFLCACPEDTADRFVTAFFLKDSDFLRRLSPVIKQVILKYSKLKTRMADFLVAYQPKTTSDFSFLYENIAGVVRFDIQNREKYWSVMAQTLMNPNQNEASLMLAAQVLKVFADTKYRLAEVMDLFSQMESHPANTLKSLQQLYYCSGQKDRLVSSIVLGERVFRSPENPFGWQVCQKMPALDETVVLMLGGDATISPKDASGYVKKIEEYLTEEHLKRSVRILGGVYDYCFISSEFMAFRPLVARNYLTRKYHRWAEMCRQPSEEDKNPTYVRQLFTELVLPRLVDETGRRLPCEEAMRRIRKLNVVAHCHGGYTFLKLEEEMRQKMVALGYTAAERAQIQKQLLCVAYAPMCPLGVSQSAFVSFCSVRDASVQYGNRIHQALRQINADGQLPVCYFPERLGQFFCAGRVLNLMSSYKDHDFMFARNDASELAPDGKNLMFLMGQVLSEGIRSSLDNRLLPSIDQMMRQTERGTQLFQAATANGKCASQQIYEIVQKSVRHKYGRDGR